MLARTCNLRQAPMGRKDKHRDLSPLRIAVQLRYDTKGRPETVLDFEELEESLTRLESIDAVRVVAEFGKIAEVHVLAAALKPAKQVVRDVQSLAMARYGANIDRRVISVVQLARLQPRRPRGLSSSLWTVPREGPQRRYRRGRPLSPACGGCDPGPTYPLRFRRVQSAPTEPYRHLSRTQK